MIKLLESLSVKNLKALMIFANGLKSILFYGAAILIAFTFSYNWAIMAVAMLGVTLGIVGDINQEFIKKYKIVFPLSVFSGIPFYAIIVFTMISANTSDFYVFLPIICFMISVYRKYMSGKLSQILRSIIKETASIKKRIEENTINLEVASVLINNQSKKLKASTGHLARILVISTYVEIIVLSLLLIYVFYSTSISSKMIFFSILIFFMTLIINYFISEISKLIINKQI